MEFTFNSYRFLSLSNNIYFIKINKLERFHTYILDIQINYKIVCKLWSHFRKISHIYFRYTNKLQNSM